MKYCEETDAQKPIIRYIWTTLPESQGADAIRTQKGLKANLVLCQADNNSGHIQSTSDRHVVEQ